MTHRGHRCVGPNREGNDGEGLKEGDARDPRQASARVNTHRSKQRLDRHMSTHTEASSGWIGTCQHKRTKASSGRLAAAAKAAKSSNCYSVHMNRPGHQQTAAGRRRNQDGSHNRCPPGQVPIELLHLSRGLLRLRRHLRPRRSRAARASHGPPGGRFALPAGRHGNGRSRTRSRLDLSRGSSGLSESRQQSAACSGCSRCSTA